MQPNSRALDGQHYSGNKKDTQYRHSFNRKMCMEGGKPFKDWMAGIKAFIKAKVKAEGFKKEMNKLARGYQCMEEVVALYDSWYNNLEAKRPLIPLYAVRALFVCAQVKVAECLMEHALIATEKLPEAEGSEATYYQGKIASARYFLNNILPNVYLTTEIIRDADDSVLNCPEEALIVR